MEKERLIEIIVGLMFIILLFIMVLFFINISSTHQSQKAPTTIINSFNNYNNREEFTPPLYKKPVLDYKTGAYYYINEAEKTLKYTSRAGHYRTERIFTDGLNNYEVYVKNREYNGGYFTVRFYLKDHYGKTRTETKTYYIKPREEKRFIYHHLNSEGKKYKYWKYEVISHTKIPKKTYELDYFYLR